MVLYFLYIPIFFLILIFSYIILNSYSFLLVGMNPMLGVTVPVKVWANVHNCCLGHYKRSWKGGAKA